MRSSLKPMYELIKRFKKHIRPDFVNAMKKTSFGTTFVTFYSEKFGGDKGLKSNISVLKIVYQYDRDSKRLEISGKRI